MLDSDWSDGVDSFCIAAEVSLILIGHNFCSNNPLVWCTLTKCNSTMKEYLECSYFVKESMSLLRLAFCESFTDGFTVHSSFKSRAAGQRTLQFNVMYGDIHDA